MPNVQLKDHLGNLLFTKSLDDIQIRTSDIVSNISPIPLTFENGKGVDKETKSVVSSSTNKISGYVDISGGLFKVISGTTEITSLCDFIFYNTSKEGTFVFDINNDKVTWGSSGDKFYHRIRNEIAVFRADRETKNAKYVRISVPNEYSDVTFVRLGDAYKLSNDDVMSKFLQLSSNRKIIRSSWFLGNGNEKVNNMIKMSTIASTLYIDEDLNLTSPIDMRNGEMLSLVCAPNVVIRAASKFDYLLKYEETKQFGNYCYYDYNGVKINPKPLIQGGIFDGAGKTGGFYIRQYHGLEIDNVTFSDIPTDGIFVPSDISDTFELLVHNCRFVYYLLDAAENTAIRGNIEDSMFNEIVIIGYKYGINTTGGSNRFYNIHGWIAHNYQTQYPGSIFMKGAGIAIGCYADTYEKGFVWRSGAIIGCTRFSFSAIGASTPVNEIESGVKQIANGWN